MHQQPPCALVIGAGSWGSALAIQIARSGTNTLLWGRNQQEQQQLIAKRQNQRYLPGIIFPDQLQPVVDLPNDAPVTQITHLLLAVPSNAFVSSLHQLQDYLQPDIAVGWATKGFDSTNGNLLHQLFNQHYPHIKPAVISGPTFATEVANGLPTAVTIASESSEVAEQFSTILHSSQFRTYLSNDITGVELGGAAKNVLAIAAGIADGLGLGANSRAALITRGLAEIVRLGLVLGARMETLMGLAGLGDLTLTCTDNQSRNRRLGLGLGAGRTIAQMQTEIGQAVEGVVAAPHLVALAHRNEVEMPIAEQVYAVLYQGVSPQDAVEQLLSRKSKYEHT